MTITVLCKPKEYAEIHTAAATYRDPDGMPRPLTADQYLLACHKEKMDRQERTKPEPSETFKVLAGWLRDGPVECWVWDYEESRRVMAVVTGIRYTGRDLVQYVTEDGTAWLHAEPVKA
jgi:hypothetical protein